MPGCPTSARFLADVGLFDSDRISQHNRVATLVPHICLLLADVGLFSSAGPFSASREAT